MSAASNGFHIYDALDFRGRTVKKIYMVLIKNGMRISLTDLRKYLSKAARVGLMKKNKTGYRMEYRVCDNLVKITFVDFLKEPKTATERPIGMERWRGCTRGPVCSNHRSDGAHQLERSSSLLSIISNRFGRSWSFLKNISIKPVVNLKRAHPEGEGTAEPEVKKLRRGEDSAIPSQVLESCWEGVNDLFKRFKRHHSS